MCGIVKLLINKMWKQTVIYNNIANNNNNNNNNTNYSSGKHLTLKKTELIPTGADWNMSCNNQAQASDQFLATTKLATNKAICLKTKNINKSKMYF